MTKYRSNPDAVKAAEDEQKTAEQKALAAAADATKLADEAKAAPAEKKAEADNAAKAAAEKLKAAEAGEDRSRQAHEIRDGERRAERHRRHRRLGAHSALRQAGRPSHEPLSFHHSLAAGFLCLMQPEAMSAELDFYRDVYPILKANCISCHNKTTTKAGLNMESPELLKKGGESGAAVVPGKSAESLVVQAAAHEDDYFMPPKNNKSGAVDLTPTNSRR